mgnify:CR=1 FL=1
MNNKTKLKNKLDLVSYWKWMTVGFVMLLWIVLHYFMKLPEWWVLVGLAVYLLINALICYPYVLGMIGNYYYIRRMPDKAMVFYEKAVKKNTRNVKALYNYALVREMCKKSYGLYVEMPKVKEEEHHSDFDQKELDVLWQNEADPVVKMILVMCYTGFRIGAFGSIETHLEGEIPYFKGGVKTEAGKNRVVPIHSLILPIVKEMNGVYLCGKSESQFRRDMKKKLIELGIDAGMMEAEESSDDIDTATEKDADGKKECRHHTPHSCRHTFSRLCESYDVKEADRKRMMGHSLKSDITNGVYGHRNVAELKREIEKIEAMRVAA